MVVIPHLHWPIRSYRCNSLRIRAVCGGEGVGGGIEEDDNVLCCPENSNDYDKAH